MEVRMAKRKRLVGIFNAAALACVLSVPSPSYSVSASNYDDRVVEELSALGKPGETTARAREQVLEILQHENACTAWFQGSDADPAGVVRSLHFTLERNGPSYIYGVRDTRGWQVLKHPWAARSIENGGRDSTILLNANGPFFHRVSVVMLLDPGGMPARPDGNRLLRVSSYDGNSPEAQITILLHELGHIIGRLPEDADSWDSRSSQNTTEVLRHCKTETLAAARNSQKHVRAASNPAIKVDKSSGITTEATAIAGCLPRRKSLVATASPLPCF